MGTAAEMLVLETVDATKNTGIQDALTGPRCPAGRGNPASMGEAPGGMPGPSTGLLRYPRNTSPDSGWSCWWQPTSNPSAPLEPPYAEPHVRWCERAEGVIPHLTQPRVYCPRLLTEHLPKHPLSRVHRELNIRIRMRCGDKTGLIGRRC